MRNELAVELAMDPTIEPVDGAAVTEGGHVSVYCGSCRRWVDGPDGVDATAVKVRHFYAVHNK